MEVMKKMDKRRENPHEYEGKDLMLDAPAGYGKTSLLIDYINKKIKKTAWLSIDVSDNLINAFFHNLCYSINKAEKGLMTDVLDLWSSESKLSIRSMLDIIIDKLSLIDTELNIVLDDFHYIKRTSAKVFN